MEVLCLPYYCARMFWGLFDSSHRRLNSRWLVGGWNFPQNPLLFFNGNAKVFCDFRRCFCRRWSGWPNEVWISVDQWHVIGFPGIQYAHYLTHFVKPWPNETDGFEKKAKEIVIQLRAYLEGTSGSTMVLLSISGLHREGKAGRPKRGALQTFPPGSIAGDHWACFCRVGCFSVDKLMRPSLHH